MPYCAVHGCKNTSSTSSLNKDGITFHLFPKNPELRNIWTIACNRHISWTPTRTSCICSRHFEESQFQGFPNKRRILVNYATPTLCLSTYPAPVTSLTLATEERKAPIIMIVSPSTSESNLGNVRNMANDHPSMPITLRPNHELTNTSKQVVHPGGLLLKQEKLKRQMHLQRKKIKRLQSENRYLRKKIATFQNFLQNLQEKSIISREDCSILGKIDEENQD